MNFFHKNRFQTLIEKAKSVKDHFKKAENILADVRLEAESNLVDLLVEQKRIRYKEKTNQLQIRIYERRVISENKRIDIIQQKIDSTQTQIK